MEKASQCVDPEALMPIKYGFNKLVLVGDPVQLPATGPNGKVVRTDVPSLVRGSVMKLDTQYKMYKDIGD